MGVLDGIKIVDMARGHTIVHPNLKAREGKQQSLDLLDTADVLISATRPVAMKRLGWIMQLCSNCFHDSVR